MRNVDDDITPEEAGAITSAMSLTLELLQKVGPQGAEIALQLEQVATNFKNQEGEIAGARDTFRAFHLGFITKERQCPQDDKIIVWGASPGLSMAHRAGQNAARLNYLSRQSLSLFRKSVEGPFDDSDVRNMFDRAMNAVATSGKRMAANR